jgi:plasmid stabilization system protein ParE
VNATFDPDARREYFDAIRYYSDHAGPGVAAAFISEFERVLAAVRENPAAGAPFRGCRRFLFRRFPYSLVYEPEPRSVHVLALAHQSRRPGYWSRRK